MSNFRQNVESLNHFINYNFTLLKFLALIQLVIYWYRKF